MAVVACADSEHLPKWRWAGCAHSEQAIAVDARTSPAS
jgi:hypothetical protein